MSIDTGLVLITHMFGYIRSGILIECKTPMECHKQLQRLSEQLLLRHWVLSMLNGDGG